MRLKLKGSVIGDYTVSEHLADGAYAEVYLATGADGTTVVLKALNARLRSDERIPDQQVLWHLENEVEAYRRVKDHSRIVSLIAHGEHNGDDGENFHYLMLEYMPGGDLRAYCREQRLLPPDDVIRHFGPLCDALASMHSCGIIHCDINPTNLLLDDRVNPTTMKLADFGVAKILKDGYAADRFLVGTSPYAAPEHSPDSEPRDLMQPVDERADIYALAMTIFFAMTGSRPKLNNGELDELPFHPSFQQYRAHLSDILGKATSARVEDRYASVAEFWGDFKDYKSVRPVYRPQEADLSTVSIQYDKMIVTYDQLVETEPAEQTTIIRLPENVNIHIVWIPQGQVLMGSTLEEIARLANTCPAYLREYARKWLGWEHPQHRVEVKAFWLGKYPVTVKQWRVVATKLSQATLYLNPTPCEGLSDEQPVTMVSWEQASEFCLRLSLYLRRTCQLPGEAEWEYACRAGTLGMFNFAGTLSRQQVNYSGLWPHDTERGTRLSNRAASVGSIGGANAFGLHDMHGNIWEWCADAWHDNYAGAPDNGHAWDDVHDALRVARGGSSLSFGISCRSASRTSFLCFEKASDLGFRILLNEG